MLVRTLVEKRRGTAVRTIESDRPLADAAAVMREERVALMIVTREGRPVGALSPSDVLFHLMADPVRNPSDIPVGDAMSPKLIAVGPDDGIDETLAMMMASDIHRIPVVEGNRIVAILPVRELFQNRMEALTSELHHLQDYITDLQEAHLD